MRCKATASSASILVSPALGVLLGAGVLGGCDGPTGGYPPPPPAFEASASALEAARSPKFRPLVALLLAHREAARTLGASSGDPAKAQELFAKSREAARKVSEAVEAAALTEDEKRIWNEITSLDDAKLAELGSG